MAPLHRVIVVVKGAPAAGFANGVVGCWRGEQRTVKARERIAGDARIYMNSVQS